MQTPSASDPSFKAFLDKLQEQNNRGFASQLIQLKTERENAGEDNDKRQEQLNDVILSLKEVKIAVTGVKLDVDLTPLVNIGENQTKLLEELSKEASLTRKLTEGSVEYDKEAAQYRNTSGRDIESKVSGKTSKDGGFIDFETARDTLSGQGKRAKEANAFDLKPINYTPGKAAAAAVRGGKNNPTADTEKEDKSKYQGFFNELESGFKFFMTDGLSEKPGQGIFQTPSKDVEKKDREADVSSPRQENPEADNVASTGEILADTAKSDLELSKQMLDTTKAQLVELKAIREALAPKTPKELTEQKGGPTTEKEKESEGGGSLLGDLASGAMDLLGGGKKAAGKVAGKAAGIGGKLLGGAKVLGSKAVGFANSGAGKLLGSVAAVGLGAYTAYEGFTAAEDSKQAKMEEVQAKVDSGEMKPEEAAAARKEIGNTATVEKSGAIGEGTGMAAGAIAGAKLGAMAGTFIGGPVGTAVGGLAGGAIGAFAGSKAGKVVGEYGGKAINAAGEGIDYVKEKAGKLGSSVSGFFGGIGDKVKGAYGDAKTIYNDYDKGIGLRDQPMGTAMADQLIGSVTSVDSKDSQMYQSPRDNISSSQRSIKEGITAEKSILGSAALGGFFTAKGKESGSFLGSESKDSLVSGKIEGKSIDKLEQEDSRMLGKRVSGGLFGRDKYSVTSQVSGTKGDSAEHDTAVTKSEYKQLQELNAKGDVEGAKKKLEEIKTAKENSVANKVSNFIGDKAKSVSSFFGGIGDKVKGVYNSGIGMDDQPVGTAMADQKIGSVTSVDSKDSQMYQSPRDNISSSERTIKEGVTAEKSVLGSTFLGGLFTAKGKESGSFLGTDSKDSLVSGKIEGKSIDKSESQYGRMLGKRVSGGLFGRDKYSVTSEVSGTGGDSAEYDTEVTKQEYKQLQELNAKGDVEGARKKLADIKEERSQALVPSALDVEGSVGRGSPILTGKEVAKTSTENADMGREAGRGGANNTVVSNNVSSNNTTKIVPMKANPRPEYTGSSLDRYTSRISVY